MSFAIMYRIIFDIDVEKINISNFVKLWYYIRKYGNIQQLQDYYYIQQAV